MKDLKQFSRRIGFKSSSAGPWNDVNSKPEENNNDVGKCGHYDIELSSDGYCRDENCRRARLKRALETGEAIRIPNGNIIWYPGTKIRK